MTKHELDHELLHRFRSEATTWASRWTTIEDLKPGAQAAAKQARDASGAVAFVKILNRQKDPERRVRMYQEIVSIQRLDMLGVPKLIETNAHHYAEVEYDLYVAMEFIDGATLTELIPRSRVSAASAVAIALELCRILRKAHDAGICHRDIKPDNVMLVEGANGTRTYLVDFGIAHLGQSDAEFRTETNQTIGNAFLALPEFRGGFSDKGDPRSDLTLCVGTFFYMLTKSNPIVLMDSQGRLPHQRQPEKTALTALGLPAERLRLLFDRGFSYNIADRFQTLHQLEEALNGLLKYTPMDGPTTTVSLNLIRERLDGASEGEKRNRMAALNAAIVDAESVLHEIASSLQGRVLRARSNRVVTADHATMTDGFQLSTDSRRFFAATFDAIAVGNEVILRVKGPGVARIALRTPFLTPFEPAEKERIKEFLLAGLDLMTRGEMVGSAADAQERNAFATKAAEKMVDGMVDAVTDYILGEGSTLMVMDTPQRPATARLFQATATAQGMVLARLTTHDKYARFNCLARVEIPNHRDESETEADQEIVLTVTDGRTGSGPTSSIRNLRYVFTPLKPSQQQIGDLVQTVLAKLRPVQEGQAESVYDHDARAARELIQSQTIDTPEQERFLGEAIDLVAGKLRLEVCAGMRRALGEPEVGSETGSGACRQFSVRAQSAQEGARATIIVKLVGRGPEYQDLQKAQYTIELSMYAKPRPGGITGNVQTIQSQENYYGPGRPGISAENIQAAIIREIERVKRFGK